MENSTDFLISLQAMVGKQLTQSPSNFMNWLAPTLITAERGALRCSYQVREEMTNPYQILHGGVTAGIIDDLIGATVYTLGLNARYTTINNAIDYFAPARNGDRIEAVTAIIKQGQTIINVQCEVFLVEKNRLIARGISNMLRIS